MKKMFKEIIKTRLISEKLFKISSTQMFLRCKNLMKAMNMENQEKRKNGQAAKRRRLWNWSIGKGSMSLL